ncbi:tetratricopeptide repeat protein [Paraburkholderia pallida]|uniref:Tetratricopeptide repeat protein n=2 Tax=Paraburkholderia pallida TaxID=2547399 RepID=A0A4V1B0T1_9BURK|nr:tetratricopeptide repeat protein [Paraburkholderia pallida]
MAAQQYVDPRFAAWLVQETGIDAESLGSHALARAVAARAALVVAPDAQDGAPEPHGARATHAAAMPAQWAGGAALPEAVRDAYWTRLTTDAAERQALIDALVVPETWFFREREAFAALARGGAQRLAVQPGELVRVLSVPCSTGEEPYSAAMALIDAGFVHEQFGIDAIDISAASIEAAARGVYGRNAFRGDALAFRERYFHATPDGWQLADAVRRAVSFERANLFDWLAAHPVRYDFIFCRNVLIYFDREAQDRAIGLLRARLADGGMIFVGPAETGLMMRHEWMSAQIPLAFGFTAPGEGAARGAHVSDTLRSAWAPGLPGVTLPALGVAQPVADARRPLPAVPLVPSARAGGSVGVTIPGMAMPGVAARGVATPGVATPGVATPGAPSPGQWAPSATVRASANGAAASTQLQGTLTKGTAIHAAVTPGSAGRAALTPGVTPWGAATRGTGSSGANPPVEAARGAASPGIATLASARRLADAGALDEAARAAAQVAQASPHDAEAWYLLGLIADAQGRAALALEHYRKALYLEPGHYEALTHLAALLEVQGDVDGARRLMRRAERAAQRSPGHGGVDA